MGKIAAKAGHYAWIDYVNARLFKFMGRRVRTFIGVADDEISFPGEKPYVTVHIPVAPITLRMERSEFRTRDEAVVGVSLTVTVRPQTELDRSKPEHVYRFSMCVPAYKDPAGPSAWLTANLESVWNHVAGRNFEEIAGAGSSDSTLERELEQTIADVLEHHNFLVDQGSCFLRCTYPSSPDELDAKQREHGPIIKYLDDKGVFADKLERVRQSWKDRFDDVKRELDTQRKKIEQDHVRGIQNLDGIAKALEEERLELEQQHETKKKIIEQKAQQNDEHARREAELADLEAQLKFQRAKAKLDAERLEQGADEIEFDEKAAALEEKRGDLRVAAIRRKKAERSAELRADFEAQRDSLQMRKELLPRTEEDVPFSLEQLRELKQQHLEHTMAERAMRLTKKEADGRYEEAQRRARLAMEQRTIDIAADAILKLVEVQAKTSVRGLDLAERKELIGEIGRQAAEAMRAGNGMINELRVGGVDMQELVSTVRSLFQAVAKETVPNGAADFSDGQRTDELMKAKVRGNGHDRPELRAGEDREPRRPNKAPVRDYPKERVQ